MKILAILSLLIVASQASKSPSPSPFLNYIEPGAITDEIIEEYLLNEEARIGGNSKISTGFVARRGEYPEFCYLSIRFFNKLQTCGCWIYDTQYVVTSARCVVE